MSYTNYESFTKCYKPPCKRQGFTESSITPMEVVEYITAVPTTNSVKLIWKTVPNADHYVIDLYLSGLTYNTDPNRMTQIVPATVPQSDTLEYAIGGLASNTKYTVEITAKSGIDAAAPTTQTFKTLQIQVVDCQKNADCQGNMVCDTNNGKCVQAPSCSLSPGDFPATNWTLIGGLSAGLFALVVLLGCLIFFLTYKN